MSNTSFSIVIPKPCHEDWNKMTPDQKGAFCGSCQKSVYDFTNKTDEELIAILEKNKDKKICGRFDSNQLERSIEKTIPNYLIETGYSRLQAFAMALFLVFGSMLFNCETASAQKVGKIKITEKPVQQHVQGEMVANPEPPVVMTGDTLIVEPKNIQVLGGPKFIPVKPTTNNNAIKTGANVLKPVKKVEPMLMGDICVMPTKGEVEFVETPKPVQKPIQKDTIIKKSVMMGKPSFVPDIQPEVKDTTEEILMGKFSVEEPIITEDTAKVITPIKDTVIAPEPEPMYPIMGMMVYRPELPIIEEPIIEEPIIVQDTIVETPIIPVITEDTTSIVREIPEVPVVIDPKAPILEVMPNPSNGRVILRYTIKVKDVTVIELYNIAGSLVKTFIASQQMYEGVYSSAFDISELQDGIYICQMRSGERTVSSKVILTK